MSCKGAATLGMSECCVSAIDSASRLQSSGLNCYMLTHAF